MLVVLVAAAAFFLGYWGNNQLLHQGKSTPSVGTAGQVDIERAREAGAAVGEKTAAAATKAGALLGDGALTAKIKSKMALDDTVRSRTIDVSTTSHVVTVSGHVGTGAERDRALQLARETAGVSQVIDHLTVDAR
ncbi:MAG TPA: BON domain-containing protein [Vicinamibacterales bacterium]